MDDLISRQAAIDAISKDIMGGLNYKRILKELPSTEPRHNFPEKTQLSGKDTTSDCISRQAATTIPILPKEHRQYQTMNIDDAYDLGWLDCQNCIEKLPSAQPEPKKGKWVIVTDSRGQHAECPYCGEWKYHQNQKFCGECGAKMEVE